MSIPNDYRLFLDVIKGLDEAGRNRLRQDLYAGREHAFIQDPLLGNRLFASDKEDWLSGPRWRRRWIEPAGYPPFVKRSLRK